MMKANCFIYHVSCEAEEKVDDLSIMTEHAGLKKKKIYFDFLGTWNTIYVYMLLSYVLSRTAGVCVAYDVEKHIKCSHIQ
jgi:hypothetical protein